MLRTRFSALFRLRFVYRAFGSFSRATELDMMNNIGKKLGINEKEPAEWKGITKEKVIQCGGGPLLQNYENNLFTLAESLYPEQYWYGSIRVNNGHWDCIKNQRQFFQKYALKNGLATIADLAEVKYRDIQKQGGSKLLKKFPSLYDALENIYPEYSWKELKKKRPLHYWSKQENQRKELERIRASLGINSPSDWKNISSDDFKKENNGAYLLSLYNGSFFGMLKKNYPELASSLRDVRPRVPTNYWKSIENQRKFMEELSRKLDVKELDGWYTIPWSTLKKHGATGLLAQYPSFFGLLKSMYPDHPWNEFRMKNLPKRFWQNKENHKRFLDYISDTHSFTSLDDWNKMTWRDISKLGGHAMLQQYSSVLDVLQTHFPHHSWSIHDRKSYPPGFWKEKTNHRIFLDQLAKKMAVHRPQDWKQVSCTDIIEHGGSSLLNCYPSFYEALIENYPDITWNVEEVRKMVPHSYFRLPENQKHFLSELQKKEKISSVDELIGIPLHRIKSQPGGFGLLSYFHGNWLHVLQANYPEIEWDASDLYKRSPDHLDDIAYHRAFLDQIQLELGVSCMEDWYSVRYSDITALGGQFILARYESLISALQTIYPEYKWDMTKRNMVSRNHWEQVENIRHVVEEVERMFKIKDKKDWYRISGKQMAEVPGGAVLLRKYNGLYPILKRCYPKERWSKAKLSKRDKRSAQRWLFLTIKDMFPAEEVIEDFFHEELTRKSNTPIQIDVYLPERKFGFEFNGEHHYKDIPALGHLDMQQARDHEKLRICEDNNVKLVIVPFWWDKEVISLKELILSVYPSFPFPDNKKGF